MVTNSRATTGVDSLRPLNIPVAVQVKADTGGIPVQMKHSDLWIDIIKVADRWRIDDEWWREERVSRTYFQLLMQNGQSIIMFHDDVNGTWYWQRYG